MAKFLRKKKYLCQCWYKHKVSDGKSCSNDFFAICCGEVFIKDLHNPELDTDTFLCSLLSLSEKELYYLIEYGFVPHVDIILKLAQHFNVTTDYLLCRIERQDKNYFKPSNNLMKITKI